MSQPEAIATCEKIFARHLGGHALINNASHLRGSAIWLNFPRVLCKHWSHKAEVEFSETHGRINFSDGKSVEMSATQDYLSIVATTGARGDLEHWKQIIEQHLLRFAFREDCTPIWDQSSS